MRRHEMRKLLMTVVGALIVATTSVAAEAPDANTVLMKTKEAFEPAKPSIRTLTFTDTAVGESRKLVGHQARKIKADGKWMATVMLAPPEARGVAFLVNEPKDPTQGTVVWMYMPFLRRVRKVVGIGTYEHFLGTDFTYADLGFVRSHGKFKLVGTKEHAGTNAYELEEKPPGADAFYSRIVWWIAQSNMLPLERDYYDPAGVLWKTQICDSATVIDGVPTFLHVQLKDLEGKTSTDLNVSSVKYDVDVPDSVFDPDRLPALADDPLWKAGGVTP
jgi:outer membrane lipoprotein-sorting protein